MDRVSFNVVQTYVYGTRYGFGPVWDWDGAFFSFGWQFGKWIIAVDVEVYNV